MRRLRLPESMPSGIEVWRLDFDFRGAVPGSEWALLSEDEEARALRFRSDEDRVRSVATRAALRRLLAERMGQAPQRLRFVTNRYGKPRLQGEAEIEFNVSHAGDFALIVLSTDGQVGVDIEYCDPWIDVDSLAAQVLSPREREFGVQTTEGFFRCWVAKESVLKALGLGIAEYLQAISVLWDEGGSLRVGHGHSEWEGVRVWSIEAPDGYVAALARVCHGRNGRDYDGL